MNVLSPLHVREASPGTHTFFHTYTCPVYCWRSVQLLDFSLSCGLIHASQPIRTSFTGQCFASGFLQTPPHGDALAFGCILPTAGRIWDFHPLERAPAGHTRKPADRIKSAGFLISNISAHRNSTASIKYFVINYLLALQSSSYRPNRFKNFCHIFKVFASLASPSSISSV